MQRVRLTSARRLTGDEQAFIELFYALEQSRRDLYTALADCLGYLNRHPALRETWHRFIGSGGATADELRDQYLGTRRSKRKIVVQKHLIRCVVNNTVPPEVVPSCTRKLSRRNKTTRSGAPTSTTMSRKLSDYEKRVRPLSCHVCSGSTRRPTNARGARKEFDGLSCVNEVGREAGVPPTVVGEPGEICTPLVQPHLIHPSPPLRLPGRRLLPFASCNIVHGRTNHPDNPRIASHTSNPVPNPNKTSIHPPLSLA